MKYKSITELNNALKNNETNIRDVVSDFLGNVEKNNDINALLGTYTNIDEQIEKAEKMFKEGSATNLTGVPIVLKDNLLLDGQRAGAASKILENYKATYTTTAVQKLVDAGAILIGRANMDEFAMGGSTENSAYGTTKNPLATDRVPGGSSGGSAAAVAAEFCLASLGTDTGGSIRQPASFCGIVGFKPSYGAVSRYGAIAMGSSLDQIGPLAHNVEDARIVFDAIKGADQKDATSIDLKPKKAKNKKIGVPMSFVSKEGVSSEVLNNFKGVLEKLTANGYEIVDIDMESLHHALSVYYILMPAEVSSNLARFDGIRYGMSVTGTSSKDTFEKTRGAGFGKEVRRRILLGTYILSHGYYDAYYNKAQMVREKIKEEFNKKFDDVSFILTPTTPTTAFKIGEKSSDPLEMYLADIFTVPANIAGVPAISLPSGFDKEGLPFGIQFTAPYMCDEWLFEIGKEVEILLK